MSLKQHQQNSAQPRNHLIQWVYVALFLLLAPVQVYAAPNVEQAFPAVSHLVTNGPVLASASYGLHTGEETGHGVVMDVESALVDPRFPKVTKDSGIGQINAIIEDGLGGWVIGGDFTHVGGVKLLNLAYVQADLSVSTVWRPNPNGIVHALLFHTREVGLRLLVGGEFTKIHGEDRSYFAELHTGSISKPVTTVDLAISGPGPAPNGTVRAIATADADDEIEDRIVYIGGDFTTVQGTGPRDSDGDGVLDIDINGLVGIDMDGNGTFETTKMIVGDGAFDVDVDGDGDIDIDVNDDGIVDFDIDVKYDLDLLNDPLDTPLVGTYPLDERERIAALDLDEPSNGMVVREWNPNVDGRVNALQLAATRGRLFVGGNFTNIAIGSPTGAGNDVPRRSIAELNVLNDLNVLTTWNPGEETGSEIKTMLLQEFSTNEETGDPRGLLYVGGDFTRIGNQNRDNFAVLDISLATNNATAWDVSFKGGTVNALAQEGDSVYVGGAFTTVDSADFKYLARIRAADRALDTSWNPVLTDGAGEVAALAIDGGALYVGGKFTTVEDESRLYIGGDFTYIGPSTGSGVVVGPSPSVGTVVGSDAVDGDVYAVVSDGGGGWYIGGSFSRVGGEVRNNIAHINSDGTVDLTWDPNANGAVRALAVNGTNVYVGGDFTSIGTEPTRNYIALINSGGAATAWDPGADNIVRTLIFDDSGNNRLYVGGDFTMIAAGTPRNHLAAFNTTDGSLIPWDPNANAAVYAMAIDTVNNHLYVGGDFTAIANAPARNHIARININHAAIPLPAEYDVGWNPDMNGPIRALALGAAGVYVGGDFSSVGVEPRNNIALINGSAVATAWDPNANGSVAAIFLDSTDNVVYVGGDFTLIGSLWRNRVASFAVASDEATVWNPDAGNTVHAIARKLDGTGNVFIGGAFASVGGATRERLAAIDSSSGQLIANFNVGTDGTVRDLLVSADGATVFVAGDFTSVGGQSRNHLAALKTTSGSAWLWNPNVNGSALGTTINDIEMSPDEDLLYVAGLFETIGGATRNNIGAINVVGGGASEWDPSVDGEVYSLALRGSEIFIGGEFHNINTNSQNVARPHLAGLSTTLVENNALQWAPAVDAPVRAIALAGTTLYIGGDFRNINDSGFTKARDYLAAIDTSANAFNVLNWKPSANDSVYALALTDDAIFAGGDFTAINSLSRERLAALDFVDGTPLPWWDLRADATVRHLGIGSADDRMVVAGDFRQITTTAPLDEHLRQGLTVVDVGFPRIVTNPPAGAFDSSQSVDLSCIDLPRDCSGTVYYTINSNAVPTVAGAPLQTINISANTSLQLITVDDAGNQSELQSMLYVIDELPPTTTATTTAPPASSLPDGEVLNGNNDNAIILDCIDVGGAGCAEIYYTIDGTTPTDASLVYTAPIVLTQNTTLKYFAFDQARNSEALIDNTGIKEEQYWLDLLAPTVVADPPTQIFYEDNISLKLLCSDDPEVTVSSISDIPDADNPPLPDDPPVTGDQSIDEDDRYVTGCSGVYYTLDDSVPTQSSTLYTGPISISASTVVKFIAVDHAGNEGRVQRASYIKNYSENVGAFGPLAGGLLLLPLLVWRFSRRHFFVTQGYRDRGLV